MSQKHATQFNLAENQRAITSGVALQRCLSVLDISSKCSGCGVSMTDNAALCIRTVCIIALNNYVGFDRHSLASYCLRTSYTWAICSRRSAGLAPLSLSGRPTVLGRQHGMLTTATGQKMQMCKIQDGGRPPF